VPEKFFDIPFILQIPRAENLTTPSQNIAQFSPAAKPGFIIIQVSGI
jgi:hypothetical protein